MRLLLLRHGQTPSNVLGALDTAVPGAPLTELGERQAAAVPAALETEPIGGIYASTLLRTQQTAAPLAAARGIEVGVFDGLKEIQAGSMELATDKSSLSLYVTTAFAWAKGDLDVRMPGGEDGHEFFARFDGAIERVVAAGGETAVVVSHGAAIRTWVAQRSENTHGQFGGIHQLDNTGLAILEDSRRHGWRLVDWIATPVGGATLADAAAVDPTGEMTEQPRVE